MSDKIKDAKIEQENSVDKKVFSKKKKLIILIVSAVLCVAIGGGALLWYLLSPKQPPQTSNAVKDNVIHKIDGTLHKVNVSDSNVKFVVNGESEYKIYVDLSDESLKASINKSASFVKDQI